MSQDEKELKQEELEQAVGGRNEIKRQRKLYEQSLEERKLKAQGGSVSP